MEIIFGDPQLAGIARVAKTTDFIFDSRNMKTKKPLRMDDLSLSTKEKVALESALDEQIYQEALQRFDHWPSYNITTPPIVNNNEANTDNADDDEDNDDEDEDEGEDDYGEEL